MTGESGHRVIAGGALAMQSRQRWSLAQDYERTHWEELARKIAQGRADLQWYRWKAGRALERLAACGIAPAPEWTAVEIGSGPIGLVGFLGCRRQYAIDPLMGFYERFPALIEERPEGTIYVQARGESLPLADGTCDLMVIDNCIDHCEDPRSVLVECRRVLGPSGLLLLTVNVRSRVGRSIRRVVEALVSVDRGHPHSYDLAAIRDLVRQAGFEELRVWQAALGQSIVSDWRESRVRTAVKVGSLTIERLFEGVWRRTGTP